MVSGGRVSCAGLDLGRCSSVLQAHWGAGQLGYRSGTCTEVSASARVFVGTAGTCYRCSDIGALRQAGRAQVVMQRSCCSGAFSYEHSLWYFAVWLVLRCNRICELMCGMPQCAAPLLSSISHSDRACE